MAGDWNYKVWGDRKNPVLVFLHGFLGSHQYWQTVCSCLSKDYYCVAPDLPGHGNTAIPHFFYSIKEMSESLALFIKTLGICSYSLAGYSMGGRIALYTALVSSENINSLILESASPGIKGTLDREQRVRNDKKWAQKLISGPIEVFLKEWYQQPILKSLTNHALFGDLILARKNNNNLSAAQCLTGMSQGKQPDLWPCLPELKIPTLLIAGEKDKKYVSLMDKMNGQIENSRLIKIKNSGHNCHFENPKEYIKELNLFLKGSKNA